MFIKIQRHLFRKLFSFYRVTSALLESMTVIIVMVILMFSRSQVSESGVRSHVTEGANNYQRHSFIALVEAGGISYYRFSRKICQFKSLLNHEISHIFYFFLLFADS